MSTTVISQGYIAVLINPITDDEAREELSEKLYDDNSSLELNYEGTLLISDEYSLKSYSEREFYSDLFIVGGLSASGKERFIELANKAGLLIDINTIQPYTCVWYNGGDSPHSMMTKEEFLSK